MQGLLYNANGNSKEPLFYIRSSQYMYSRLLTNKPGPRLVVQKVESDLLIQWIMDTYPAYDFYENTKIYGIAPIETCH